MGGAGRHLGAACVPVAEYADRPLLEFDLVLPKLDIATGSLRQWIRELQQRAQVELPLPAFDAMGDGRRDLRGAFARGHLQRHRPA